MNRQKFLLGILLLVMPKVVCELKSYINGDSDIAIVSLYNPDYRPIGKYSDSTIMRYGKLHGYDVHIYHDVLDTTRPAAWSKILAIAEIFKNPKYRWIKWHDADSMIMRLDIDLKRFIDENYDMIITHHATLPYMCTGSFFIKNSEWSKKLLEDIYQQTDFINHQGFWEQSAFEHLVKDKPEQMKHIKVLHQRTMNSHISEPGGMYEKGDFIIHFYGPIPKRPLMKHFYMLYRKFNNLPIQPNQQKKRNNQKNIRPNKQKRAGA